MEYNLDVMKEIINLGASVYPKLADPSTSQILKKIGVISVTAHIEKMGLIGLVKDASPFFNDNFEAWIGYSLTDLGKRCATDNDKFNEIISQIIEKPRNEVSDSVRDLVELCRTSDINKNYKEDFIKTLNEIATCFDNECYIATITLCGKILEVCLCEILQRNRVNYDNKSMLGNLIRLVKEKVSNEYIDQALEGTTTIISKSRNTAVHFNERIPIPSRDQAIMVIFATRDVVARNLTRI